MNEAGYQLATALVAAYGAILATLSLIISLVLGVFEIRRHRPSIRVTANHGTIIDAARGSSESLILMDAVNVGPTKVTISSVGWLLRDKSKLQFAMPYLLRLPAELEPGKKLSTFWPCRLFREQPDNGAIKAPYFADETGRMWKGKILKKQRALWLSTTNGGWRIS